MASLNQFTDALGEFRAAHLLRRCTFGPTSEQIKTFAAYTPAEAVDELLSDTDSPVNPSPPLDTGVTPASSWVNPGVQNKANGSNSEQDELFSFFKAWHVDVMLQSDITLRERITWFYHTHIPARWTVISSSEAIYYQNCLFRHYAYGSFKELFKKICIDNAMLRYLDGHSNVDSNPNENFAREMFELYGIGKGPQLAEGDYTNYTEQDIKAATRVLTGWTNDPDFTNIDTDSGIPIGVMRSSDQVNAQSHDMDVKKFSSKFSNTEITSTDSTIASAETELDEMMDMMFAQMETARFITRKLYRQFVYHFISDEAETDIIEPLAQILFDNEYKITEVLKTLLVSEHFYDEDTTPTSDNNIGALIKSPIDLSLGLLRLFNVDVPDRETETEQFYSDIENAIVGRLNDQGLSFYEPFEVAGYPAYHQIPAFGRNWIMPTELHRRYQTGDIFMQRPGHDGDFSFKLNILSWVDNTDHVTNPETASEVVEALVNNLYAVEIDTERFNFFLNDVFLDTLSPMNWTVAWNAYKSGGAETEVKGRLENLLSALIQTPEFQLY